MINRFIKRAVIFISIPLTLILIAVTLGFIVMHEKVENRLSTIAKSRLLLMGDSQIQRLDSSCFQADSYMLASSGEPYYITYHKLSSILDQSTVKVEEVVLGVSAHNFAPVYNKLLDPLRSAGERCGKRYFHFLDITENIYLTKKDLVGLRFLELAWSEPSWGGYIQSELSNPDSSVVNKIFRMHYREDSLSVASEGLQTKYLTLISTLCQKHNIDLILLSTPYHQKYLEMVHPKYFDTLDSAIRELKFKHYIDFVYDDISSDFMSDANHLNTVGSSYFTAQLIENLSIYNRVP